MTGQYNGSHPEPVYAETKNGIPRYWKQCEGPECGRVFMGTKKSRFCSGACRVAGHRADKLEEEGAAQHGA